MYLLASYSGCSDGPYTPYTMSSIKSLRLGGVFAGYFDAGMENN